VDIKAYYNKIPQLVKSFLLRALLIFIGWQLAYNLVLLPARVPDTFLTNATAFSTEKLLSVFYHNVSTIYLHTIKSRAATILIDNHKIISIADPCNALDIYVLYISFLFCFPGNWKRRLKFIVLGSLYIFLLNTIRCGLIAWLNINYRGWVEISHHYIFTTALYLLVFYVWVLYSKKGVPNETR
jgi:exosortase family protein XrtF